MIILLLIVVVISLIALVPYQTIKMLDDFLKFMQFGDLC